MVEIDPVVHEFASKYFQLPKNHTAVIQDAVSYTDALATQTPEAFDYIVHDVFTGGAEPIPLFTLEFLQNLHALLKPSGVIAIVSPPPPPPNNPPKKTNNTPQNYAADFALPPPMIVVATIRHVFPTCRLFREHPRNEEQYAQDASDFVNMVIFCTKQPSPSTIAFRQPSARDLLNSPSREAFLLPKHEVRDGDFTEGREDGLLTRNDTGKLGRWHGRTAVGHWTVMRTVLPEGVWVGW